MSETAFPTVGILYLSSTQTPKALQTGYGGRWQKRFEVIAHFREEKGPNCLRSPQLPPCNSLACHWRKKRRRKRLREIESERRKKNKQERERELERTVSLCSCSCGCFWITSVLCQRKERRTDRQGIRGRRERGTLHKSGLLVWEGGPGLVLGVLSDRAVIVSRLKWVKPGLNSAAGSPRHHCAPPSTS